MKGEAIMEKMTGIGTMLLVAVLTMSSMMFSCSGGGGGGSSTTGNTAAEDTTAPTVSSTTPANNGTGTAINAAIAVVFSEAMDPSTVTAVTFHLDRGVTGAVVYDAANRISTLKPSQDLLPGTTYQAAVTTGVKDAAGNALSAEYTWAFTTGTVPDTTAPVVASTIPASGAANVPVNAAITATFSEAMDAGTIGPATFQVQTGGGYVVGTVTYAGTTASFTPVAPLAYSTTYTATIATGAKDLAGNGLAAVKTWTFTTGVAPDVQAPAVQLTDPNLGATGIDVASKITVTFSEAMDQSTLSTANFLVSEESGSPVLGTVTPSALSAVFDPISDLEPGTKYSATITTGVKDIAGNALANSHAWTFTTLATAPAPTFMRLNGNTPAGHNSARAAFNNSGVGVAAWVEYASGSQYRIFYATYSGGVWRHEAALPSSDRASAFDIASDGTTFMMVYNQNGTWRSISFDSAGNPGASTIIKVTSGFNQPSIATGGPGQYAAAWVDYVPASGKTQAMVTTYSSGAWGTPVPVSNTAGNAMAPSIASKGGGAYGVAWTQDDSSVYNLYANIFSGGAWTTATAVLVEDLADYVDNPKIASDGKDYAITWVQGNNVYANISSLGTWTLANTVLVENVAGYASFPAIASNGSSFAIVWQLSGGELYANISSISGWNADAAMALENSGVIWPSIASSGVNYAVSWNQYDWSSGFYRIHTNIFSSLTSSTKDTATAIDNGQGHAWTSMIAQNGTAFAVVWNQEKAAGGSSIYGSTFSGSWDSATDLVQGAYSGSSEKPVAATNKYGETLAVWVQYSGTQPRAFGRMFRSGSWGSPFQVSEGYVYYSLDVATNGTDFMLIYYSNGIKTRTCDRSGVLGQEYDVRDPLNTQDSIYAKLASNGTGYAAVWLQYYNGYRSIYANIYSGPAQTWSGAVLLESLDTGAYDPIALASNGRDYAAAWTQYNGPDLHVYAAMSNGSTWGSAEIVDRAVYYAHDPQIVSNGSTYAVVWGQSNEDVCGNVFSSLTTTTKDGAFAIANSAGPTDAPAVASNGVNYAAAWRQADGYVYSNVFSTVTASTRDSALKISFDPYYTYAPVIASDGTGYAVVWRASDGSVDSIYASTSDGSGWLAPFLLENGSEPADQPFVTSNGNSYSAVWRQIDPADSIVYDIWIKTGF
jgi:Big-like domain-containing protein